MRDRHGKRARQLFANAFTFDVVNLPPPHSPERYIEALQVVEEANQYSVVIIDSASHEWEGEGGCLEIVDHLAATKFKGNKWGAWSDVTPRHQKFITRLAHCPLHIIVTARSKTETAQNDAGKVQRLGMKICQRDGFEYEFTIAIDILHDSHAAIPLKDNTGIFNPVDPEPVTAEHGKLLLEWLNEGISDQELIDRIIKKLEAASSLEVLQELYKTCYAEAKPLGNQAIYQVRAAKDRMKKDFEHQPAPEPLPTEGAPQAATPDAGQLLDEQMKAMNESDEANEQAAIEESEGFVLAQEQLLDELKACPTVDHAKRLWEQADTAVRWPLESEYMKILDQIAVAEHDNNEAAAGK